MKLRFNDGDELSINNQFQDVIDFAEAALDDEIDDIVDPIERLRDLKDVAGPGTKWAGYADEASDVINQIQLGNN
jgi:hypothetical protein